MTAPTLNELFAAISADFKNRFSISSENDLKRVLTALAASNAGMLKLFYLALEDVKRNIWPDRAYEEEKGGTLERFGRVKLGRAPYPAKQGEYKILITGTTGTTLPIGTQLKSSSDSTSPNCMFTTTENVTIQTGAGKVTIISDNAGKAYELSVGDVLYTVNPITNINSKAVVDSVLTQPIDAENIEEYRALVLQAFRLEPNGGSPSDYVYWSLDVDGIRTVYPYTTAGTSGVVTIYAEATPGASTDGHGTPSQTLLDALWKSDKTGVFELDPDTTKSIYDRGRRQLGLSDITISPVTPLPVVVSITNLKTQNDSIKASIKSEIEKTLFYKRPFIAGVGDINDKNDTLYLSDIIGAIQNAVETGNTFNDVSITVNGLTLPYQFINGDIPYLSEVLYV